jgi:hypothetical protein
MPQARVNGHAKPRTSGAHETDAITMLKTEHREVEALFEQFEETDSAPQKKKLAAQICTELRVHMQIEDEILYPACRQAGLSEDKMDEADIEHDTARKLIDEVEAGAPGDDHWDARVKVLSELIEHHVKEEEEHNGIFSRAKKSDLDLDAIGEQLRARKAELMKQI